jgi:cytoskeletal protein RodZ
LKQRRQIGAWHTIGRKKKVVDHQEADAALFPERVGDRLRAARTKSGLDLSDIATKTRVPLRHLHAIEASDYSSFPSITYCIGFVRAFARAVGEDEAALVESLKQELGETRRERNGESYDPADADPARIPGPALVWTAAVLLVLLAIGYGVWRSHLLEPRQEPAARGPEVAPAALAPPPPEPQGVSDPPVAGSASQVVLTATDRVWMRVYESTNEVLFEKEMAPGESYQVPADASNPMIRTGRAELLKVTIDGREVAPLGEPDRTIKDVGISAAALSARPAPATGSPPTPAPTLSPPQP